MEGAAVLVVFESEERAEEAVDGLRRNGFDAGGLSVIGKDDSRGQRSAFWTRLGRELPGAALLSVPIVGHVVALGAVAARLDAERSSIVAMLMRAGMSAGAAATYEAAVRGGQILVLVHGTAKDVLKARSVLREIQKCMQP